jgi:hypothetical protein
MRVQLVVTLLAVATPIGMVPGKGHAPGILVWAGEAVDMDHEQKQEDRRGGAARLPAFRVAVVADEWEPLEPLLSWLAERDEVVVVVRYEQQTLPDNMEGCRAVFMYVHRPLLPENVGKLIRYARGGGRLVILHHGLASAKMENPEFMQFVGMYLAPRDDPEAPWRVIANATQSLVNLNLGHFLTSNGVTYEEVVEYRSGDAPARTGRFPALRFADTETFVNQQFTDGREKTVLFGVKCPDPATGKPIMQDRGGWLKPQGKGRVFYFQTGHRAEDFEKQQYRQVLLNCLLWEP